MSFMAVAVDAGASHCVAWLLKADPQLATQHYGGISPLERAIDALLKGIKGKHERHYLVAKLLLRAGAVANKMSDVECGETFIELVEWGRRQYRFKALPPIFARMTRRLIKHGAVVTKRCCDDTYDAYIMAKERMMKARRALFIALYYKRGKFPRDVARLVCIELSRKWFGWWDKPRGEVKRVKY